ncbi:MAG TPA: nitroreductase family protein [Candidatus Nitrosotenuis sp.]|nr:nitroreductase family protein [Candidatus Nitrosotenuis sp.]
MSFFELISSRHSVRAFKEKRLQEDAIKKILNSAVRAASAGNLQSYQIFVVENKQVKHKLSKAAHDQSFVGDASAVFVFCADPKNSEKEYGSRGRDLYCIQDATIACAYAQLAAHALGLATVWVGSFDERSVADIIKCGSSLIPVAMLVVGFADEEPQITPRRPMSELVHRI